MIIALGHLDTCRSYGYIYPFFRVSRPSVHLVIPELRVSFIVIFMFIPYWSHACSLYEVEIQYSMPVRLVIPELGSIRQNCTFCSFPCMIPPFSRSRDRCLWTFSFRLPSFRTRLSLVSQNGCPCTFSSSRPLLALSPSLLPYSLRHGLPFLSGRHLTHHSHPTYSWPMAHD